MRYWLTTALAIAVAMELSAQSTKPTFDVVSVKPAPEARLTAEELKNSRGAWWRPGGVFIATKITVAALVAYGYDLKPYQIVGGPEWIRDARFTINARASEGPESQAKLMVQSLLEDRFKLMTHGERREMPYFALMVARSDGRLGPYLRKVPEDCAPDAVAEARKQFPPRPRADGPVMSVQCAPMSAVVDMMNALSMSASSLTLVDETNLRGKFVMEMKASSMVPGTIEPAGSADPSLPSFTIALEEQLGLKLESRKGPANVLVIESVQKPAAN